MKLVFILPVMIAALNLAGLVIALLADDAWNWLTLICLVPCVALALRTMVLSFKTPKGGAVTGDMDPA